MNIRKKILTAVIIAEVLVLAAAGVFLFYLSSDAVKVKRQLEKAEHYLEEQDTGRAIEAFEAVLDIDPGNVDAYLGLAELYEKDGELEKAVGILEKGVEETGSKNIARRLDKYNEEREADAESEAADENGEAGDSTAEETGFGSILPRETSLREIYTPAEIDEALKAYQDRVYTYGYGDIHKKCGLFYLNDDNMPECAVWYEDSAYDAVFLYLDGELVELNAGFGTVHTYQPKQNILSERYGLHQTGGDAFYRISDDGKSLECLGDTSYVWGASGKMEDVEINGIPSDEQGYQEYIDSFGTSEEDAYSCAQFTDIRTAYRALTGQTSVCNTYDFLVSRFEISGNTLYIDTVDDSNAHESSVSYPVSPDFRCLHRYTDGSGDEITYEEMKQYLDDKYRAFTGLSGVELDGWYDSSPGGFSVIIQDGKVVEVYTVWS